MEIHLLENYEIVKEVPSEVKSLNLRMTIVKTLYLCPTFDGSIIC